MESEPLETEFLETELDVLTYLIDLILSSIIINIFVIRQLSFIVLMRSRAHASTLKSGPSCREWQRDSAKRVKEGCEGTSEADKTWGSTGRRFDTVVA